MWNLRHVPLAGMPVYCCRISLHLPEEFREASGRCHPAKKNGCGTMKILVRAPNWVGDAVMAIPALEAIRRWQPGGEIFILARPAVAALFSGQPFADRILEYDYRGTYRGWWGREKLIRELARAKNSTVALLLQNAFEAAWLAWRAGIRERIGYARDGRGVLAHESSACAEAGRDSPSRIALLFGIASPRWMGRSVRRRSRQFGCKSRMPLARRRNLCCSAQGQGKARGAARSHREPPMARQSAGRRSDSHLSRIA